jgi:hypothetical protein
MMTAANFRNYTEPNTVELLTIQKQRIALGHIEKAALNAAKEPKVETLQAEMNQIAEMAARGQTCPFED